jgi:hypothetical protein
MPLSSFRESGKLSLMSWFALLFAFLSLSAGADGHFYLTRPHSGIELVCIGTNKQECRISRTAEGEAVASKTIDARAADHLLSRFARELKKLPANPKPSDSMAASWNIAYRGYSKSSAIRADRASELTLMGIEAELRKRLP